MVTSPVRFSERAAPGNLAKSKLLAISAKRVNEANKNGISRLDTKLGGGTLGLIAKTVQAVA